MENVKPWQIILIVLAFAVLGFSVLKFGIGGSVEGQMANTMTLVDVQTGQLYIANIGGKNGIMIPTPHPETDEIALVPVYEEDGEWFLRERYMADLHLVTVPQDAITGRNKPLKILDNDPIRLK